MWCRLQQLGIADYVQDLVWALEQFPTPPVLISHSMGAFVTLRMLQRHQADLAGLILMSPGSERSHYAAALRLLRDFPILCCKLSLMNYLPKQVWPWWMTNAEVRRLMLSRASSLETSQRLLPRMQHESLRAMMDMLRPGGAHPPRMPFPKLILCGAEDIVVPPEFVRRTAEWLRAEMRVEPGMGHAMMLEDGWQTAAESILKWLERQPHLCGRGASQRQAGRQEYA